MSTAICEKWSVIAGATFYPMWGLVKIEGNKSSVRFQSTMYLTGSVCLCDTEKEPQKNTGCIKRNDLISMCSSLPFTVMIETYC